MLLEPSDELISRLLPPVYKVQLLDTESDDPTSLAALNHLPTPLGAIENHSQVRLATVTENVKLTKDGHF